MTAGTLHPDARNALLELGYIDTLLSPATDANDNSYFFIVQEEPLDHWFGFNLMDILSLHGIDLLWFGRR
jgi:hypothetical protein